jgi:PTH1 family peptidyl-tRNA hydrolase
VGLGNPGPKYEATRHNVGFLFLDWLLEKTNTIAPSFQDKFDSLVAKTTILNKSVILVKPQTYMNLSGPAVQAVLNFYKVDTSQLIVIFDDLDQEPGKVRMRKGGGHGGHNGVRSILECLPDDFHRIKMGIGKPEHKGQTASWVLNPFTDDEWKLILEESFPQMLDRLKQVMR